MINDSPFSKIFEHLWSADHENVSSINGNRTEWTAIRSVIRRVTEKIGRHPLTNGPYAYYVTCSFSFWHESENWG